MSTPSSPPLPASAASPPPPERRIRHFTLPRSGRKTSRLRASPFRRPWENLPYYNLKKNERRKQVERACTPTHRRPKAALQAAFSAGFSGTQEPKPHCGAALDSPARAPPARSMLICPDAKNVRFLAQVDPRRFGPPLQMCVQMPPPRRRPRHRHQILTWIQCHRTSGILARLISEEISGGFSLDKTGTLRPLEFYISGILQLFWDQI